MASVNIPLQRRRGRGRGEGGRERDVERGQVQDKE